MRTCPRFLVLVAVFFALATPIHAEELPTAACGNSSLVITQLPNDDRRIAVRINDKANGWNLENPFPGDHAEITQPKDGKFTFSTQDKHTYDWWVHIENADGSYGSAIGGAVYCGAGAPESLTATCKDSKLNMSWKKTSSADHYAVRIDDAANPWSEKELSVGDSANNNVKETRYQTKATMGHGYNVWVHAVDTKGIFSPATKTFVSCKTATGAGNIFDSISAFFRGLLPR